MDKIGDISTNLQSCFTELEAKGVTVPADSSLDDLATLIGQVPDASHPDLDLPWIMTDGATYFTLSQTMQRTRSFFTDIELAPLGNTTNQVIWGCRSTNSNQGNSNLMLYYTDTSVYSYRRLIKNLGTASQTGDVNNYAEKTWSGYPFYKKQRLAASYLDTTGYRASVQYNGSWTTAGSTMAQTSSSQIPDMVQTVFARANFSATGLSIENWCNQGTKIYWIGMTSGNKDTSTMQHEYVPILHWDVSTGKYQPCFIKKANGNLGSYPKATKGGWADGTAYYIDVAQGLESIVDNVASYPSFNSYKYFDTNISHESGNVYVLYGITRADTENTPNPLLENYDYGGDSARYFRLYGYKQPANSWLGTLEYNRLIMLAGGSSFDYSSTQPSTSGATSTYNFIYSIPVDSSNSAYSFTTNTTLTNGKTSRSIRYDSTPAGKLRLCYKNSNHGLRWLAVYNNNVLTHYITLCNLNGTTVYYDCIAKTIIYPN